MSNRRTPNERKAESPPAGETTNPGSQRFPNQSNKPDKTKIASILAQMRKAKELQDKKRSDSVTSGTAPNMVQPPPSTNLRSMRNAAVRPKGIPSLPKVPADMTGTKRRRAHSYRTRSNRTNPNDVNSLEPPMKKRKVETFPPILKTTKKRRVRGLRFFSKLVLEKVRERRITTYSEVSNDLVEIHVSKNSSKKERIQEEKNIRRRVYDALNVLVALEIISKNRKEIRWKGYPVNVQHELEAIKKKKTEIQKSLTSKRNHLNQLKLQKEALLKLYHRNTTKDEYKGLGSESKVKLPFIVVHTEKSTVIECQMDAQAKEVFFNFSQPFEIHDDNEILQKIFEKELAESKEDGSNNEMNDEDQAVPLNPKKRYNTRRRRSR